MPRFNRKRFFDGFDEHIDSTIQQEQVDGLEFLLARFEADGRWKDIRHIAYALATIYHETAYSFQPVEEGYYLGSKAKVARFQKTLRYYPYFGRGYVQLTWLKNYKRASDALGVDLVKQPELALEPANSFEILTAGLFGGWFGGKLTTYINSKKTDYVNARRCVNVMDKAGLIAAHARTFEKILRNSAAEPAVNNSLDEDEVIASNPQTPTASTPQPNEIPASLTAQPTNVIEVEQVAPAPDPAKEDTLTRIGNKAAAVWTAAGTAVTGIVATFTSAPVQLIIGLIVAAALLGIGYMAINALRQNAKEKRDLTERQEREKRAHELQMLTAKSAAEPGLNAIRIVPTPIANSESAT